MGMERVTVEQNGERFTLEVPEGTSDADIQNFLTQQQGGASQTSPAITQPGAQPGENIGTYVTQAATTPAVGGVNYTNVPDVGMRGPVQPGQTMSKGTIPFIAEDMAKVGTAVAKNATLGHALELIKKEGLTGAGAEFAKAVLHPFTEQTLVGAAKNIGGGVVQGLTAPENLMTLPYNMAAYEQAKIRANPNAPEYANNPYAMTVRGQAPNQAAAGAMNQQQAVRNYSTLGNPMPGTAEFARLQQQYQDEQTLKQPPDDKNFMARMTALSRKYLNVK